ncbi:hypothetical protein BK123_15555 [Paenibacillus lautus]|uniref:Uncharacterized protein n=1 Tax=Paenibacillus lautus TaxID=1401 RepID=A0A1R1B0H4_PAELA|nr:hypothetical protein BK123_15555 [Paenibacillus lautus]
MAICISVASNLVYGLTIMRTLGLLCGSSNLIVLWIITLGIGGGFAFRLSMMFFGLRTENAKQRGLNKDGSYENK